MMRVMMMVVVTYISDTNSIQADVGVTRRMFR